MDKKKRLVSGDDPGSYLLTGSDNASLLAALEQVNHFDFFNILPQPVFLTRDDFVIVRANNSAAVYLEIDAGVRKDVSFLELYRQPDDTTRPLDECVAEAETYPVFTVVENILTGRKSTASILPVGGPAGGRFLIQLFGSGFLQDSAEAGNHLPGMQVGPGQSKTGHHKFRSLSDDAFLLTVINSLPHPFYVIESQSHRAIIKNQAAIAFEDSLEAVHCFMKEKPESCIGNAASCALMMVVTSTTPVRVEHEFISKTGEKRIHEVFGYPVFNSSGEVGSVIQYSIDITDRKRNEIELREYQEVLDNLMNNLPGMAFRCLNEANWTMEYVSPGCRKLTGYNANELVNNKVLRYGDLIHPDDRRRVWSEVQTAVMRRRVYRLEYRIVAKNGRIKYVLEQGKGVYDKFDKLVRLEGLVTDISEGKQAEIRLKSELAINQGLAAIGVELLNDSIKPARVANMVQNFARRFTGSRFSLMLSPAVQDGKTTMFCYDESSEKGVSKQITKGASVTSPMDRTLERLLNEMQPVMINEQEIQMDIPCVLPGHFSFNRLMSVPAFINNQYAGIIILADADQDYTEEVATVVQRFINMFALAVYRLKAEESLQLAKEKAEESDRLKSLFLSNMSHEIRTPMNAILGFAEMLQDAELSIEEKDKFLEVIIKSGDNLLRLINDIIDISKIEAGQLKIVYSDCYLNEMLSDLEIFFSRELTRLKKDHLYIYMQPGNADPDFALYTDPVRLRQIITNLTGNAIKFTDEGFIEIGYRINAGVIEFYVRDSGIGIPVEQQKLIFERFGQVREAVSRNLSGTGLGLTISKNLVELLGGRMWLDSYPGEGSTFWFSLPLKVGRQRREHPAEAEPGQTINPDLTGKCILVVEDVDTNYFYISSLLEKLNGRVLRAGDGQKAVEMCRNNPEIGLVLMDIELPVMDGYIATRKIKELRADLPVIAQTAFAMTGERERCLEAGCDDYIAKPIRKEVLFEVLSRFI